MLVHTRSRRLTVAAATVVLTCLGASACGSTDPSADGLGDSDAESDSTADAVEVGSEVSAPRLVVTTDGGVVVLEGESLEQVAMLPADGFLRVNAAGDDRHAFVSTAEGFQLLDTGVEVDDHGDHAHYSVAGEPALGTTFAAPEPGHVTVHDGRTLLFSDGAGTIQTLETDDPTEVVDTMTLEAPHHGVAVALGENLLHTEGTAESRSSVVLRGADDAELARTDDCPGVHGEATAAGGVAVVGCEDGVVVVRDGQLSKVDSPDAYGRIGNQAGHPDSPIVLGDYKVDEDATLERPERISLIDTQRDRLRLVDLGTSYSFRSLGRGPAGEALVLGTDGRLHVLDPESGEETAALQVVDPWQEPTDWQQPRPTLQVAGDTAWVTEPTTSTLHEIDLATGTLTRSVTLDVVPDEIVAVG